MLKHLEMRVMRFVTYKLFKKKKKKNVCYLCVYIDKEKDWRQTQGEILM